MITAPPPPDLDAVTAALAVLYARLGLERPPRLTLLPSPLGLLPAEAGRPGGHALPVLEQQMAGAIAASLQALAAAGGEEPMAVAHDGSDTGTGFASGRRLFGFEEWDRARGRQQGRSAARMVAAAIGWWRGDVLALEEVRPRGGKDQAGPAFEARAAMLELAAQVSFGLFAPARALVVAHPVVRANAARQPHAEGARAIEFADGWGLYALNGVSVPDWLALTPAEHLPPQRVLEIRNGEERREFVRKVGVERICQALGHRVLGRRTYHFAERVGPDGAILPAHSSTYELINLDLKDGRARPYLKMLNPSVPGVYHLEGVPPDIGSVQEAINWRAHRNKKIHWHPEVLT